MTISQATLNLLVSMQDEASAGLGNLSSALGALGTAGLAVAAAGITAIGVGIANGVGDAQEARKLYASTEQTIKTMGDAAGVSAQHVVDLATNLSDASGKSLFGDDQIQQSENLLLTFGNIKGETFDLATALTTDLAQALGGAPADQAMMLGKALNDPIKGISALGKAGLTFSEEQKAAIAAMVKSGDVAGAQAIIIKELNAQVGGQAAAAAQAAGGWVQFKAGLGETFEMVGGKLLPILDSLGAWLNSPDVQAAIATFADQLANGIGVAAAYLSDVAIPALMTAWTNMQPAIAATVAFISGTLIPILMDVATWLQTNIPPAIAATADFITNTLIPALQAAWAYLQANVIPILIDVVAWLATNLPPAIQAAAQFVTGTLIPALQQVWAYIQENVIPIISTLVTWLIANVPPAMAAVSDFITNTLVPAFQKVWAFIQDNVMPILTALANVAIALVKKEIELLAALWNNVLWPALQKVWAFIDANIMPIFRTLASFVSDTLGAAFSGLGDDLAPMTGWFNDIAGAVKGATKWLNDLATSINSIHMPDWVEGHSPPPLANWFSSIASSAEAAAGAMGGVSLPNVSMGTVTSSSSSSDAGIAGAGGTTVRIVFDSGALQKLITATVEQALSDSGGRALSRIRQGG
jgi:hypothetical protein